MKKVINFRVVEGDPNEVRKDEILLIKDSVAKDKILDIQKRVDGKLVSLITERYTFTINPSPADAKVVINDSITNSVRAAKGHTVTWSVSKSGYITQSGKDVISGDVTKNITLVTTSV